MNTKQTTIFSKPRSLIVADLELSVLARIEPNKGSGFEYLSGLVIVRCSETLIVCVHNPDDCVDATPFENHWTPGEMSWALFMKLEISILNKETFISLGN